MPIQLEEQPKQITSPDGTGQLPVPESDIPSADELAAAQAEQHIIAQKGPADPATEASERAFEQAEANGTVPVPAHESAKNAGSQKRGLLSLLGIGSK